ncbi:hypothetical protein D3C72_1762220 [compost metagenome]
MALEQPVDRHRIGCRQQQQHQHHRIITLLPDAPEHGAHQQRHDQREGQFQQRQQRPRQVGQPGNSRGQPQQRQRCQRRTAQARLAGPGLSCSEQKTGDDRQAEAEQQFVAMPGQPATGGLPVAQRAIQCGQPQRHGEQRQAATGEEKGTERQP